MGTSSRMGGKAAYRASPEWLDLLDDQPPHGEVRDRANGLMLVFPNNKPK